MPKPIAPVKEKDPVKWATEVPKKIGDQGIDVSGRVWILLPEGLCFQRPFEKDWICIASGWRPDHDN